MDFAPARTGHTGSAGERELIPLKILVAGGFSGPTNLAIDADGTGAIYVAEPTSGRISTVTAGVRAPFVDLPSAGSLEWSAGKLFATTVPAGGTTTSIVSISR